MKLAKDVAFLERVQYTLVKKAAEVLGEPLATAGHNQRAAYARACIMNPAAQAPNAAVLLVGTTNFLALGEVTYDDGTAIVTCNVDDAEMYSQVTSSFSALAGVETGS